MSKWTVALFGHYKPQVTGYQRRAFPGDVIAYKPYGQDWSRIEKAEFLIITVVGPSPEQMPALVEGLWDLNSYQPYNPVDFDTFQNMLLDRYSREIPDNFDVIKYDLYADYLRGMKERAEYPTRHLRKRRFNIPLNTLESMGVNLSYMLDKEKIYVPRISEIEYTEAFDKRRVRSVQISDGLREIQPRTLEEMTTTATERIA